LGTILAAVLVTSPSVGQPAEVEVRFTKRLGPMQIERMGLGQGGLSEQPMWQDRVAEIQALKPGLIRLFIQEYFDLLP
jgi:hypothetical protein